MTCQALKTLGLCLGFGATLFSTSAAAVDLIGGDAAAPGRNGTTLSLYGHINKAFFWADDGLGGYQYFGLADNANSSTRIGLKFSTEPGDGWNLSGRLELQVTHASTGNINQTDKHDSGYEARWDNALRHLDLVFGRESLGTLSLGQGSMASDGAAEYDLSGTTVVALSPAFVAGGLFFRQTNGVLSTRQIGDDYRSFDGLRLLRVRYDTPVFLGGFTGALAYGHRQLRAPGATKDDRTTTDIALRYANTFGDYKTEGAVFYEMRDSRDGMVEDRERIGASAAVLHMPTGLNFRFALGREDRQDKLKNAHYFFVKAGVIRDVFPIGPTAFAIDYYSSDYIAADDVSAESWGLSVVQTFDKADIEMYATFRNYDLTEASVVPGYNDIQVVMTGVRWKF